MPLAYWCLLIAGLLPYAWALVAKLGAPYDNHRPREVLAHAQGHRKRASTNSSAALSIWLASAWRIEATSTAAMNSGSDSNALACAQLARLRWPCACASTSRGQ